MNIRLSNDDINMIVKSLVSQPWIEVNELIQRLTTPESKPEAVPIAVHHSMVGKDHAPYGLKKDGTPRARPGRKSAKRKARQ